MTLCPIPSVSANTRWVSANADDATSGADGESIPDDVDGGTNMRVIEFLLEARQ